MGGLPKEKQLEYAIIFNEKPKNAIELIVNDCQTSGSNPSETIAKFFKDQKENLNLVKVGEYLGANPKLPEHKLNADVLNEFTKSLDFKGKEFVPAMREYLQGFKLPGEAQPIDRLMENFAVNYHKNNPDKGIKTSDGAYSLAFSVTMLNTDLHNPSIKKKMTSEEFVKNNRGIDGGEDISKEKLEKIYNYIKKEEFKLDNPKYKFSASNVKKDALYKTLSKKDVTIEDIKKVCPLIKDRDLSWQQTSKPTKGGKISIITLGDKGTNEKVTIEIFKPNLRSKLTSKKQVLLTVTTQERNINIAEPSKSFAFAAQIAVSINSSYEIPHYKYHSAPMAEALRTSNTALENHKTKEKNAREALIDLNKDSAETKPNKKSLKEQAKSLKPIINIANKIVESGINRINKIKPKSQKFM